MSAIIGYAMTIRQASPADVDAIQRVARESLAASYDDVLDSSQLSETVESWYAAERLRDEHDDEDRICLVATREEIASDDSGKSDDASTGESTGDSIVAFAQSYLSKRRELVGEIDWVHVAPSARGHGIGSDLLAAVESELRSLGATRLEGRVLVANEPGTVFYERQGYSEADERDIEIGGKSFRERLYVKFVAPDGEQVLTEARTGPDGDLLYVAYDESVRGSRGAFSKAYRDRERDDLRGWFCDNCHGFDVVVDTMDRMECASCGNRSKPTRWDDAYL